MTSAVPATCAALALLVACSAGQGAPAPAAAVPAPAPASPTAAPRPPPYPYPVPASCPATPWAGPEVRWTFPAWWLESRGIAVGTPIGVLYAGGNKLFWRLRPDDPFRFSGERLDGRAPSAKLFYSGFGPSGLHFPTAGCWRIRAEAAGDRRLDAVVYVYPWGCRPENARGDPAPEPIAVELEPCNPPQISA